MPVMVWAAASRSNAGTVPPPEPKKMSFGQTGGRQRRECDVPASHQAHSLRAVCIVRNEAGGERRYGHDVGVGELGDPVANLILGDLPADSDHPARDLATPTSPAGGSDNPRSCCAELRNIWCRNRGGGPELRRPSAAAHRGPHSPSRIVVVT